MLGVTPTVPSTLNQFDSLSAIVSDSLKNASVFGHATRGEVSKKQLRIMIMRMRTLVALFFFSAAICVPAWAAPAAATGGTYDVTGGSGSPSFGANTQTVPITVSATLTGNVIR